MPIATTAEVFEHGPRAVAAFNVITLEHAEAIVAGAEQAGLPVIAQLSQNAIAFHHGPEAIAAAMVAVADQAGVPVVLHLDHITSIELAERTEELGFSSVMFDASTSEFAINVQLTRKIADWGHAHGVWVEAELGEVGGKDGAHAAGARTNPTDAAAFVANTGVDALAVAIGSSHAMTSKVASLDLELLDRLASAVPVPLVLHGSSGVPSELIAEATRRGMRKINIGTALNIAFTQAVREWLDANLGVDPRKYLAPARDGVAATVAAYIELISQ